MYSMNNVAGYVDFSLCLTSEHSNSDRFPKAEIHAVIQTVWYKDGD